MLVLVRRGRAKSPAGPPHATFRDRRQTGPHPRPGRRHGLQVQMVRVQDRMPGAESPKMAEQR